MTNIISKKFTNTLIVTALGLALSACDSSSSSNNTPDTPDTPSNTAPAITSTGTTAAEVDMAYSYTLTATDADNDTLTMSADIPTALAWLSFDAATGVLSGTPATGDIATTDITLTVNDGTVDTIQTFTITVDAAPVTPTNDAPVITSTGITTAEVGTAYSYTLTATDADSDTLTMSTTIPAALSWLTFDAATGVLSGTPASGDIAATPITLTVNDGTVDTEQTFTITVTDVPSSAPALIVFENTSLPEWAPWNCCLTVPPAVATDDAAHDQVMQFSIDAAENGETVQGFTARTADGAVGGTPFDASTLATTGTISFDLKMTAAPTAGVVAWKFKIESNNAASAAEVDLSSSNEGHTTPVLDTWQTYTFNISDLVAAGLTPDAIDVFMIFPAWGTGAGVVYSIDNLVINSDGAVTTPTPPPSSGDGFGFETATPYTWAVFENDDNPVVELVANPDTSGINTSATVAKFTARQTGNPWAGTETKSSPTFTLDASNKIVKIMVYKSVISDVGVKFAVGAAAQPELKVANTKINEWEELTFDFTSYIGLAETINIDTVIVFPDFDLAGRTSDTISYFDNITFNN